MAAMVLHYLDVIVLFWLWWCLDQEHRPSACIQDSARLAHTHRSACTNRACQRDLPVTPSVLGQHLVAYGNGGQFFNCGFYWVALITGFLNSQRRAYMPKMKREKKIHSCTFYCTQVLCLYTF